MCFLSEISSNGAHFFRPWSFHKNQPLQMENCYTLRGEKKRKKEKPTTSTSPIAFLTFSIGSTITVVCVTKQPSSCEQQQSQQFLWPDTWESMLKFMWFHTCDLQTTASPLPLFKSLCKIPIKQHLLLGLNLLDKVKFLQEIFGCFWFWKAWLSLALHCLTGQQRIKTHRTEPCSASEAEKNGLASQRAPGKISSEEQKSLPK